MQYKIPKIIRSVIAILLIAIPLSVSTNLPVAAAVTCDKSHCDLVGKYINPAIELLSITFGLIATISIILGAIQYSASEGDPQKSAAAKNRITNTIIAIIAFLLLFAFLQFLIPGGAFK